MSTTTTWAMGAITGVGPAPDGKGWVAIQRTTAGFIHHRFRGLTAQRDAEAFAANMISKACPGV